MSMAVSNAMAETASRFLELLDDSTERDASLIHTVWHDAAGDFGRDLLAHHYATSHHLLAGR